MKEQGGEGAEFQELANSFCRLIERRGRMKTETFLTSAQRLLPVLYRAALALRQGRRSDVEYPELPDRWKPIYSDLQVTLGKWDVHWEVYHPYQPEPTDPISGSLADDLASTYQDLHRGLAIWSAGTPEARSDAIWEWRFGFEIHWGHHVLDAMRALHARAFDTEGQPSPP